MADFYAARAGTNAGAPLDGFLTAVHIIPSVSKSARDSASVFQEQFAEQDRATDSLRKLRAEYNPLGAAIRANSERIETYNNLLAQGRITQEEHGQAIAWSNRQFDLTKRAIDGTNVALGKYVSGTGLARHELVNMSRQAQDVFVSLASGQSPMTVLIQQGTQIADIFASSQGSVTGFFAQAASGAMRFAGSTAGVVTLVAAIGATAVAAGMQYADSQREIERSLAGVGRQSGVTVSQINRMSIAYAEAAKVSNATAREMIAAFASTGAVDAGTAAGTAGLARNFAALTGTGATEAAKALAAAFVDPAKGAQELNRQIGFLDARTLEYIRTAQAQGRVGEAQRALADALGVSIQGAADRTSGLARAWNSVWNAASNAWDALGKAVAGQITLEERLTQAIQKRQQALNAGGSPGTRYLPSQRNLAAAAELNAEISDLQEQIRRQKAQADRDARTARQNAASTGALSVIDELNPFGAEIRKLETMASALRKGLEEAGQALNPDQARSVAEAYERVQRAIEGALTPAERQRQANELTVRSINARTLEERASVEVARLQLDSAFRLKDADEQRAIILGKIVELQAQANREARDALRNSQDQLSVAGLRPYQRREAEALQRYRDNLERFGGSVSAPVAGTMANGMAAQREVANQNQRGFTKEEFLAAVRLYESNNQNVYQRAVGPNGGYNPSVGRVTGPSTAQGYYQITNETWRDIASSAGINLRQYPNAMSAPREVQDRAASALYDQRGAAPWAPYNANLRNWMGGYGGAGQGNAAAQTILDNERAKNAAEDYATVIRSANDNIREQEEALKIQAKALTATAYETGRAEKSQELYNQLAVQGIPVTRELAAAIEQTADRYGRLREAAASVKLTQDVQFERDQLGRTASEQQIASKLRGTGVGMDSAIADQMRFNQLLGDTKSLASDSLKGFINDLRQGKSGLEALRGVLDRVATKLLDMATDQLISGLFKNMFSGSSGGGIFGSLFGGGGLGSLFGGSSFGGTSGGAFSFGAGGYTGMGPFLANGGVFGPGGMHAFANGGVFTNSIVSRPTLFPFANGTGLMGEAGPEAIVPLRRNSRGQLGIISNPMQAANANSAPSSAAAPISLVINAPNSTSDSVEKLKREIPTIVVKTIQEARRNRVGGL